MTADSNQTVPCCICFKPCVTAEDGGPECEVRDGIWTCSAECYERHPKVRDDWSKIDPLSKWDRDKAIELAARLAAVTEDDAYAEPWTLGVSCREAATLLRAAVSREDAAAQMAQALRRLVDGTHEPADGSEYWREIDRDDLLSATDALAAWDAGR